MQINQVRYFLALCEERNFTRAAKRCSVSQPTLTNAIKRLEQMFGGPLFNRDSKKVELTELGRIVRPHLERLNQSACEAKRRAEQALHHPPIQRQPRALEAVMRRHHVIALVAVLVIGFAAKQFLFPPKQAAASLVSGASINVLEMQRAMDIKRIPHQDFRDASFEFSNE